MKLRLVGEGQKLLGRKDKSKGFVFRWAQKALLVINILLVGLILYKGSVPQRQWQKKTSRQQEAGQIELTDSEVSHALPFAEYQTAVKTRNLFQPPQARKKHSNVVKKEYIPLEETREILEPIKEDVLAGLKIVGILLDKTPKVIIEDLESRETSFLSEGDQLQGAVLKEILEGKAIFLFEGRTVEVLFE
ncbi:hypothetical protein ACFL49_02970 [Candidatus Omnitrophota bacterium]